MPYRAYRHARLPQSLSHPLSKKLSQRRVFYSRKQTLSSSGTFPGFIPLESRLHVYDEMRLVSGLPILGRNPIIQASILFPTVIRSASRLSGIHQGLRRTERSGFAPRREIRQKPEEEPYLSPEERQRARAIARRNPVEYKIRKGKKDITEEPGPPRKSRAARFNDPRDPYSSNSVVKKLRTGKAFQDVRNKLNSRSDGVLRPEDFEFQMKLDEAEDLIRGPARRQHEKPYKFAARMDKRDPSWRSKSQPIDDFENVPRNGFQSRNKGKEERTSPAAYQTKDDRSNQFGRDSWNETRVSDRRRDDSKRKTSLGSREDQFESSVRSLRSQDEPRSEARAYRSEDNYVDPPRYRSKDLEEGGKDIFESVEVDDDSAATDDALKVRRLKVWEPPVVVPYTTAASQFLYGTSTVEAAIQANRRKFYKLYIYKGSNRQNTDKDDEIADMAQKRRIQIEYMDETGLTMINKMSNSRAHNGYVLEASPLPQTPVQALGEVPEDASRPGFNIVLGYQSREEATINGTPEFIMTEPSSRKPFVLLLDQILDPGNLGAVIRTASFMGVTAVVMSKRGSAPVTPTVLKASAGAAETMIMMSTESVVDFVTASKEKGWKVYAAVPPKADSVKRQVDMYDVESNDPLLEDPCVLVLGNEGEGLSRQLKRAADVEVSIPNVGGSKVVDSLNVSVAAGLLCQSFLRGKTATTMMHKLGAKSPNVLF